ncbi:MAG: NAD(P)H-dependent oxidoreductase subunit E [Chloroflexi bacterium]|nr:NAD(P)H-dependent oxidoreductase subunit E [Chloroflexota bacterium]
MTNSRIRYTPTDPEIETIAEQHHRSPEAVLEVLRDLQDQRGGLSQADIAQVARSLRIPAERAYGVASFYTMLSLPPRPQGVVRVCDGPVCWLKRAATVRQALDESPPPGYTVERTSCLGLCDRAPAALVGDDQAGPLDVQDAARLAEGFRGAPNDYSQPLPSEVRLMLAHAGKVDPDSLTSALAFGAYQGLQRALRLKPDEVVKEVETSGLTGRGGAGFPVGRKWRFVAQAPAAPKYILCNADESEPLIFKDRVLIDTHPQQILEGMAIAGYATGAAEGYIYIRGEYVHQARRLENAIRQAEEAGLLGEDIQGSGFSFHIHVHRGAGAYICGEETALIESLEGKRGEPRARPPYPPTYGFRGQPTLVNNVESYASVPTILSRGAEWYRAAGGISGVTPGTKLYMILGHVNRPGLFEAPFGVTLRQAIEDFGGGLLPGSEFNFALTGGAAGTIVPSALLDVPMDYPAAAQGVSLGAGAFLVCDQSVSPVAFLRELLHFFTAESCGKCTPCREGTHQALNILHRLALGEGRSGDTRQLYSLAEVMQAASFCGLGQSVPIPVKSALKHFEPLFLAAEVHA